MKMKASTNRKSTRIFAKVLSILIILVIAFPAAGNVSAQDPDPHIEAFAWFDRYSLANWPPGIPVEVTIVNPSYQSDPFVPDGSSSSYDFFPGVDLQPGSVITATNGEITKVLEISLLSATVDADTGTITGVATPERTFHMRTDGDRFQLPIEQDLTADSAGNWSVTIEDYTPWEWFTRGEMWEGDDDGDVTYAIWHVRNEVVEVWLAQNEIRAFDWPLDTELTFSVDGNDIATAFTQPEFWMEGTSAVVHAGDLHLVPGMAVTVTDGTTSASTVIQDIKITRTDAENDLVYGHAPAGASLELGSFEDSPVFRFFNANSDGNWQVDYQQPSVNGVTVDLNAGDDLRLFMREEDKDATVWQSVVADSRLYANVVDDSIRFEYSAPGAIVTLSIYDAPNGNLLWQDDRVADDSGFVYASIWDHRVDLEAGIYIVASDDMTTKRLLVETISLDVFDPVENILQGTAAADRSVWVVANNETVFCGTDVLADMYGNWTVDFDDYGCDVTEDMWSYAQAVDAEGDTSEAILNFIEGWHDYNQGDVPVWACNAGGWAVDTNDRERDLTVRIVADGSEVISLTAGNSREDLLGACGADGSCGFDISLWGLITPYEEHQILVQAFDEESGQWFDLNDTPKTINCRTYDIYVLDPATGETHQITNLMDTDEYDPSWSHNGKKIVHDVVYGDGSQELYVTDVKTRVSTPLAGAGDGANDAAWSPSGKWIAFDRRWIGEPNIYLVPATGGPQQLVRGDAVRADWAPNSKRIVFQQASDESIRTVAAAGGRGQETLIAPNGLDPAWSPDGNWIAYVHDGNIWKVQVNILGRVLGTPIQVTNLSGWNVGAPTWSPDSQTIIFNGGVNDLVDIWKVSAFGGDPVWLTGSPDYGDYGPENARNSSRIAFAAVSP